MAFQLKRQGDENAVSRASAALKPTSLLYGEPGVDSDGYIYVGNGKGQVVSLARAADRAGVASTATYSITSGDRKDIPFLYEGTFRLSDWTGTGPYTQKTTLSARENGPNVTRYSKLNSGPMCDQTDNQSTNEILQDTLNIFNDGYLTLGENSVTAKVWEKPISDIILVLSIKQGQEGGII